MYVAHRSVTATVCTAAAGLKPTNDVATVSVVPQVVWGRPSLVPLARHERGLKLDSFRERRHLRQRRQGGIYIYIYICRPSPPSLAGWLTELAIKLLTKPTRTCTMPPRYVYVYRSYLFVSLFRMYKKYATRYECNTQ